VPRATCSRTRAVGVQDPPHPLAVAPHESDHVRRRLPGPMEVLPLALCVVAVACGVGKKIPYDLGHTAPMAGTRRAIDTWKNKSQRSWSPIFPTSCYHIPNSTFYSPASPLDASAIQLAAVSRIRRHSMLSLRRPRTRSSFTGGVISPARRRRSRYHCRVRAARPNTRSTAAFPRSMGIGYDVTARAREHT
jgi:hypothetical protein